MCSLSRRKKRARALAQGANRTERLINYRAFMRFFSGVSPHVHHKHVLGFEWLLFSGTVLPLAYKRLFVRLNVIINYVLWNTRTQ